MNMSILGLIEYDSARPEEREVRSYMPTNRSLLSVATARPRACARRSFLAQAAAGLSPRKDRLLIDTHLEVWTLDPKFPFAHPERPNLKTDRAAPIENQVEQMRDFGLKYAVLINPRYFGWDNSYISHSLHLHPRLFVAHGLINPEDPK